MAIYKKTKLHSEDRNRIISNIWKKALAETKREAERKRSRGEDEDIKL